MRGGGEGRVTAGAAVEPSQGKVLGRIDPVSRVSTPCFEVFHCQRLNDRWLQYKLYLATISRATAQRAGGSLALRANRFLHAPSPASTVAMV